MTRILERNNMPTLLEVAYHDLHNQPITFSFEVTSIENSHHY